MELYKRAKRVMLQFDCCCCLTLGVKAQRAKLHPSEVICMLLITLQL